MKKYFFIIAIIFLSLNYSFSFYAAIHLPVLIEKSDIIIYGRIISINKETFKVVTIKKIKPAYRPDTLTIQKFKDWGCAARYSKYEIGQEAIFFIAIGKNNTLQIAGAGNEGELVVKADTAYVPDYEQKVFESRKYSFLSAYSKFIPVSLDATIKGIKIYLDNCEIINKELKNDLPGTIVYQYNTIETLPKNYFLSIVLDQKEKGLQ